MSNNSFRCSTKNFVLLKGNNLIIGLVDLLYIVVINWPWGLQYWKFLCFVLWIINSSSLISVLSLLKYSCVNPENGIFKTFNK